MNKLLIFPCLALCISLLAGCDNRDTIITSQQQQIAELQAELANAQQTCGSSTVPNVVASAPTASVAAPVIVQQPTVVHDGNDNLLTGMMLGHMLSNSGGGYASNHTTTNTTVVNHYHAAPAPAPVKRSWFSGRSLSSSGSTASKSASSFTTSRSSVVTSRSGFSSGARSAFHASRSFGRR